MARLTDTETDVKLSIPVSQKISLGIMMMGALSALFAIALGMTYELPINKKNSPPIVRPVSLTPRDITSAQLNQTVNESYGQNIIFHRNSIFLGDLDMNGNVYQDREIYSDISKSPLAATITFNDMDPVTLPARVIHLETKDLDTSAEASYSLCLPETIPQKVGDVDFYYPDVTYYFDINGTPYTDSLLTKMATSKACNQLLTNSFTPYYISEAILNTTMNDTNGEILFVRDNIELGRLNVDNNNYIANVEYTLNQTSKSPLLLSVETADLVEDVIFPARTITLKSANYDEVEYTNTFCFPETTTSNGETIRYYYDINGTPYTDSLLTKMATTKACTELLGNTYLPQDLTSGRLSEAYPSAPPHFQIYAVRDDHTMGWWENDVNTFYCGDESIITAPDENSKTPLVLSIGQAREPEQKVAFSLPARGLVLESNLGIIQLCIPALQMEKGGHAIYYYDKDGKPYSDLILDKPVSCTIPPKTTNTNTSIPAQTE